MDDTRSGQWVEMYIRYDARPPAKTDIPLTYTMLKEHATFYTFSMSIPKPNFITFSTFSQSDWAYTR